MEKNERIWEMMWEDNINHGLTSLRDHFKIQALTWQWPFFSLRSGQEPQKFKISSECEKDLLFLFFFFFLPSLLTTLTHALAEGEWHSEGFQQIQDCWRTITISTQQYVLWEMKQETVDLILLRFPFSCHI